MGRIKILYQYVIGFTEDQLADLISNPNRAVRDIKQELKQMRIESRVAGTTRARPRISASKTECPKCHLLFERKGLGVHLARKHNIKTLASPQEK